MKHLRNTLAVVLVVIGAWMVVTGVPIASKTMGRVTGSEFSMLITLNHQIALAILWLGFYGIWSTLPRGSDGE